jgi:hypothetical protein
MELAPSGDWQEQLAADPGGLALGRLRDHLAGRRADLRRNMDAGALPEDYAVTEKLLAAVEAAEIAAVAYWEKFNK